MMGENKTYEPSEKYDGTYQPSGLGNWMRGLVGKDEKAVAGRLDCPEIEYFTSGAAEGQMRDGNRRGYGAVLSEEVKTLDNRYEKAVKRSAACEWPICHKRLTGGTGVQTALNHLFNGTTASRDAADGKATNALIERYAGEFEGVSIEDREIIRDWRASGKAPQAAQGGCPSWGDVKAATIKAREQV